MIELSGRFLHLLTQEMEGRKFLASFFIDTKIDIVAHGVCWPEREDTPRRQQTFRDDPIEQFYCVIKKFLRLLTNHRVIEDRWITAA